MFYINVVLYNFHIIDIIYVLYINFIFYIIDYSLFIFDSFPTSYFQKKNC